MAKSPRVADDERVSMRTNTLKGVFELIGRVDLPKMTNTEAAVWEFHVAGQLRAWAEARREAGKSAVRDAVRDWETDPIPAGSTVQLFSGKYVALAVRQNNPGKGKIKEDLLRDNLMAHGLTQDEANKIIEGSKVPDRGATVPMTSFIDKQ